MKLTDAPARDPKKTSIKKVGQAIKNGGSDFEESIVDLEEVQRAYYTDSYIRRSVDKYSELMFKEGWEIPGKNTNATEYVWTRLKLMSEATGQPITELFKEIAHDLVLYSNAFVVKARQKGSTKIPGVNAQGYTGNQPVAGYFVLPATTITISRDDNGKLLRYMQDTGGGNSVEFKPEDIIHFSYKKPRGMAFGIPFVHNVLDDVKMLRQIEENVARLIYRNLFPLYQYQVGIDKPGYEASDEEIENIREEIRDMPMDGGIVVPERHNITVIGAEGQALDASEYLKYFRQRVFTGLGVSDSTMGIGDTANRSTSDNQSADLNDGVKEFQAIFAETVTFKMINELLFEGGFDPILNPDDEVVFSFFEIELDAKIKKENHAVQLFTQNAITHEEMRQMMGKDPVTDEGRLYFNMVTIATAQAQAEMTAQAQAANNAGDNKNRPENQNGKQNSPGKPSRSKESVESGSKKANLEENSPNVLTASSVMVNLHSELDISTQLSSLHNLWGFMREDVIKMISQGKSKEHIHSFVTELVKSSIKSSSKPIIESFILEGMQKARKEIDQKVIVHNTDFTLALEEIMRLYQMRMNRLIEDVMELVEKAQEKSTMSETASAITGAFESNQYRLKFIMRTELHRAFNYGKILVANKAGLDAVYSKTNTDTPNQRCSEKDGQAIPLNQPIKDLMKQIPAYHPNCQCTVELNSSTEEVQ